MSFADLLAQPSPILALAPMQDVTDLPFWKLMTQFGGADVYYTEYFRVHPDSNLEKFILSSITENPTGRPVIAQMIGNDIPSLVRTARELEQHNIVAIDLNLGCPAPIVYKKCAGGGLLREPQRIDSILGALRDAISIKFTVKTRLGFDDEATIETLLPIFAKHQIDLLTVHGRTVAQMYRNGVNYDRIRQAAEAMHPCPVLANGNVNTPEDAQNVLSTTNVRGLMIGRGAIRNPWIFQQIRDTLAGRPISLPTGNDVLRYITDLYEAVCNPAVRETAQVQKMKKYLGFIGVGIEPTGQFLYQIRRVVTKEDFFRTCREYLEHDRQMDLAPFPANVAEAN
jgi:nifR3 family TIM-barrel protein